MKKFASGQRDRCGTFIVKLKNWRQWKNANPVSQCDGQTQNYIGNQKDSKINLVLLYSHVLN